MSLKKKILTTIGVIFALMLAIGIYTNATMTPEEKAARQQERVEQSKQREAEQNKKATEKAAETSSEITPSTTDHDPMARYADDSDDKILGYGKAKAITECQKYLANLSPSHKLSDFGALGGNGARKVRVGDTMRWSIQGKDKSGRGYQCTVTPTDSDTADVDGAFAG